MFYFFTDSPRLYDIPFQLFSSFLSATVVIFFVDFFISKKNSDETKSIRRVAFIRASNILVFVNDIWSELVEKCIDKYDGEYIYTHKIYELVANKLSLFDTMEGRIYGNRTCLVWEFYQQQSTNIYDMIDKYFGTLGSYSHPEVLSILEKVQRCGLIQLGLRAELLVKFSDKFPHRWETLESDFKIFEDLEKKLAENAWEFPNLREEDKFDPPSLRKPSFKGKLQNWQKCD